MPLKLIHDIETELLGELKALNKGIGNVGKSGELVKAIAGIGDKLTDVSKSIDEVAKVIENDNDDGYNPDQGKALWFLVSTKGEKYHDIFQKLGIDTAAKLAGSRGQSLKARAGELHRQLSQVNDGNQVLSVNDLRDLVKYARSIAQEKKSD